MIRSSKDGSVQSATKPIVTTPSLTAPLDGVKDKTNIITDPARTTVIDLERVPKSQLLANVKGSPWSVTFYRRLMGRNDSKALFDPSVDNPTQQLERINNLVLRVLTPIEPSQDNTTKVYTREGEANLPIGVPVNEFDLFTAPIGQNRIGVFSLTTSERKTDNKQSVYHISYTMLYELTERVQSVLDACTVRTYQFVLERAWSGLDTLLTEDEYSSYITIGRWKDNIERNYVKRYYDATIRSLRIPETPLVFNDVFLTMFVRSLGLRHESYDLTIYPHMPHRVADIETLWTVLRNRDKFALAEANRKFVWMQTETFNIHHVRNSVAYSNVNVTGFFADDLRADQVSLPAKGPTRVEFTPILSDEVLPDDTKLPVFTPLPEDTYVLSETFYKGSYSSVLEKGLQMFINDQPVPPELVLGLAQALQQLPPLERCYYTPLVYLLLCYAR